LIHQKISISQAVEISLENNLLLRQARIEMGEFKARVSASESKKRHSASTSLFGSISDGDNMWSSAMNRVEPDAMNMIPQRGRGVLNFSLTMPLFTGGILEANTAKNREAQLAFQQTIQRIALDTAYQTKESFYQYLMADALTAIAQKALDAEKESLRVTEALFRAGKVPRYYVLRVKTEVAEARRMLIEAKNKREIRMLDLKTHMGISLASDLSLSQDASIARERMDLNTALSLAREIRPEMGEIGHRIRSAGHQVQSAKGRYRPQAFIATRYDVRGPRSDMFKDSYGAGIVVSLPVFDGGERKAELEESEIMKSRMILEKERILQEIQREVSTAFINTQSAEEKIEAASVALAQAREDLRVTRLRYRSGKGIHLDVLDAVASWVRAERNYVSAFYEFNIAYSQLQRAVGRY
jgi:outer membrane protein TolC